MYSTEQFVPSLHFIKYSVSLCFKHDTADDYMLICVSLIVVTHTRQSLTKFFDSIAENNI